jgi:hypothetical protein
VGRRRVRVDRTPRSEGSELKLVTFAANSGRTMQIGRLQWWGLSSGVPGGGGGSMV